MSDLDEVQPNQTSAEESGSQTKEAAPEASAEQQAQGQEQQAKEALTTEKVQQMIAEATAKAVKEAKELGKRELQSSQDRNKAELARAQRRAVEAERLMDAARTRIQASDPETARELEIAQLRAERQHAQTAEQEEAMAQQQAEFHKQFGTTMTQFMTNLGVDPEDARIDWAADAPNYLDAQRRILDSVVEIQKANLAQLQSGFEARLKDLEKKVAANSTEANSVDTSTSAGVTSLSDAEFRKNFANGTLPTTKENVARFQKLLET